MNSYNSKASWDQRYSQALEIETQADADDYFQKLVESHLSVGPMTDRAAVEKLVRDNLGYLAGEHSNQVRERVERLFQCEHPYFGSIAKDGPVTPEQAFELGKAMGERSRKQSLDG